MSISSRFAVAVHILALLALENRPLTSKYISFSVNTNPFVIRPILGSLAKAGNEILVIGATGNVGHHLVRLIVK